MRRTSGEVPSRAQADEVPLRVAPAGRASSASSTRRAARLRPASHPGPRGRGRAARERALAGRAMNHLGAGGIAIADRPGTCLVRVFEAAAETVPSKVARSA
jgi:hypothetical protein